MGAPGSGRGRRRRRRLKAFIHEVKRLDAYSFFSRECPPEKMGCFITHGFIFERVDHCIYKIEKDSSHLGYLKVVQLDCMPHVSRYLFECPNCRTRKRFLCLMPKAIACRSCLKLAYKSQNATLSDRLNSKSKMLEQKLQFIIFPNSKPKGMHYKTFSRFFDEWYDIYQMSILAFLTCKKDKNSLEELMQKISHTPFEIFLEALENNNWNIYEKLLLQKK